jgi:hypothetical protein
VILSFDLLRLNFAGLSFRGYYSSLHSHRLWTLESSQNFLPTPTLLLNNWTMTQNNLGESYMTRLQLVGIRDHDKTIQLLEKPTTFFYIITTGTSPISTIIFDLKFVDFVNYMSLNLIRFQV